MSNRRVKKADRNRIRRELNKRRQFKVVDPVGKYPSNSSKEYLSEMQISEHQLEAMRGEIDARLKSIGKELEYYALDDVLNFALLTQRKNFNTFVEAEDSGIESTIELLVYLAFKKSHLRQNPRGPSEYRGLAVILDQLSSLRVQMFLLNSSEMALSVDLKDDEKSKGQIWLTQKLADYFDHVRGESYPIIAKDILASLFEPMGSTLTRIVGLDYSRIKQIFECMSGLLQIEGRRRSQLHRRLVRLLKSSRGNHADSVKNDDESDLTIELAVAQAIDAKYGALCKIDVSKVAQQVGQDVKEVTKLLKIFSLSYDEDWDCNSRKIGCLVRTRPLLLDSSGGFYIPFPGYEWWAVQNRIEQLIRDAGMKDWEAYQAHRARVAVALTSKCLAALLPGCQILEDATYVPKIQGSGNSQEIDLLVVFNCYVIVIEVKAGSLTPDDFIKGPEQLRSKVKKIVSRAHRQTLDAVEYLQAAEVSKFSNKEKSVEIVLADVCTVLPMVVSLENMGVITCLQSELRSFGQGASGIVPWTVSVADLMSISLVKPSESVFLGYVRERMRQVFNEVEVVADELDWFGWFLSDGLRFSKKKGRVNKIAYSGGCDKIDQWMLHLQGLRSVPTERPSLEGHPKFLELIEAASTGDQSGKYWWVVRLLGCENVQRVQIGKMIELLERDRSDRSRDASMLFSDGGLSVLTPGSLSLDLTMKKAAALAELKKYQTQATWWLYSVYEPRLKVFLGFGAVQGPWKRDEVLEREVRRLASSKIFKRRRRDVVFKGLGLD